MMNEPETIRLADGSPDCPHTGQVRSVVPARDGEPSFHRSVCPQCGAWAVNLYGPPSLNTRKQDA